MAGSDVVISYASLDRASVQRFVHALTSAGLTVWWDQEIDRGRWGSRIAEELAAARTVLAFVSKAAMASGYVFAEARRAADAHKLIPVRIDNEPLTLEFEGLIGFLQSHFFLEPLEADSLAFQRLCAACGSDRVVAPAAERREPELVAAWFSAPRTVPEIALAIAIATLQNASYDTVELAARLLGEVLEPPQQTGGAAEPKRGFVMSARSRRLAAVEAECFRVGHDRLGSLEVECVRFVRPERAGAVLDYVWRELDGIREPLCSWLNLLAQQPSQELKTLTGVAVGKLAQTDFTLVHDRLICTWAMDDDGDRRETGDIALSVAAFAPHVRQAVEQILEGWVATGATGPERRAAAEFGLGYTGARCPAMGLPLLKKLLRQNSGRGDLHKLVSTVDDAILRRVRRAVQAEDSSLFDIDGLLDGLAGWIGTPERDPDPRFAIHFFLCILEVLPLCSADGEADRFSLAALMNGERAREACLRALGAALRLNEMRDRVRSIVRGWIDELQQDPPPSDPLGQLATALLSAAATERDRSRIAHLFRYADAARTISLAGKHT